MANSALIIIDMQVAMFSYPGEKPFRGDALLHNLRQLIDRAHACGVPVIYIQHSSTEEFEKGTPTWQLYPEIYPLENEPVVEKTTRDSFYKTGLQEVLKKLGAAKLVFAGMQSQYCVDTTCRRSNRLGYETILVGDAHSTFDGKALKAEQIIRYHNQILSRVLTVKSTQEVLDTDLALSEAGN